MYEDRIDDDDRDSKASASVRCSKCYHHFTYEVPLGEVVRDTFLADGFRQTGDTLICPDCVAKLEAGR